MRVRAAAAALGLLVSASAWGRPAPGAGPPAAPRPLEPARSIKPAAGRFDGAFALGDGGHKLAVVRTDGSSFAKLELLDTDSGATLASSDLPGLPQAIERLELLPDGRSALLITRDTMTRPIDPDEPARVSAALIDAAGRVAARVGPAAAFGFPSRAPQLLVAFDRRPAGGGATAYTVAPYELGTLAPAGKPRVYRASADGDIASPAFRILGFADGYTRAVGERPGGPPATLDTLGGKVTDDAESPADPLAWVRAARLLTEHPGQGRFVALNPDQAGVDIVDAMGNAQPAALAVPFSLYDPKSLRDQEGPERGALYFSLAVDTLNAAAIKRRKPDLPMVDVYAAAVEVARRKGGPQSRLVARVFAPRAIDWRAGWGKLVVLKRLKNARGGDELQVYQLR